MEENRRFPKRLEKMLLVFSIPFREACTISMLDTNVYMYMYIYIYIYISIQPPLLPGKKSKLQ